MGAVSAPRLLAVLALTAALAAGCGGGSSSDDGASSGGDATPSSSGGLELRPVYAHYTLGSPIGSEQLGPTVPQDLLSAMKNHDCSSKPSELQGMLLVCDS